MESKYNPTDIEARWYQYWLDNKLFHSEPDGREPFTVVIPPPNVTGVLHMGHVLNETIQDTLVRRARLEGKNACWVPGTDHASIATEAKVIKRLKEQGINKSDLTREEFLKHAWEWTDEHGGIILKQLRKLGCSCDWDRTAFTMDEPRSESVIKVFCDLYNKGLIYRGVRMVNWDPKALTALSDEEVIMTPTHSKLYTIRYKLADGSGQLLVSTTRPETIMADVAVAVNPKDPRFSHLIGKTVIRPLVEREIPIIADDHVEIDFGTGALKITPAHDRTDFEVGMKNNLEIIDVLTADAHINCPECPELHGLDREVAREKSIELIKAKGLLEKVENYDNNVGVSQRSDVPIEPRLSMQWFLKYPCVKEAADAVANGDITFRPARWAKTYAHWLEGIQDWCISRQLWWGHRIPVWYRKDKARQLQEATKLDNEDAAAGDIYVGVEPPADAENWVQDEDALDTWFSSWLWPFATMDKECLAKFYPTTDLVTGPDIIFFWVARMIMAGYRFAGGKPFSNVFFTSIVRDLLGRKMSKSLGNMYTLDQLQEMGSAPAALRYVLAGAYYRRPLNFTLAGMKDATSALNKLGRFDKELAKAAGNAAKEPTYRDLIKNRPEAGPFQPAWDSLEDDLNTPEALGHVFSAIKGVKPAEMDATQATELWRQFRLITEALGLQLPDPDADIEVPEDIRAIAEERWAARAAKDWAKADELRAKLAELGWGMKDGKEEYKLTKI